MSEKIIYRILRDIYSILSYAQPDELRAASENKRLSPSLAAALCSLAEESQTDRGRAAARKSRKGSTGSSVPASADPVLRSVLNSQKLSTKASIVEAARILNIRITVGPKDSLGRVRLKFIQAMQSLPEAERNAAVRALYNKDMRDLEGWLNVIKSG